ncbi:TonB-dependent receptor domain-containing protein [Pseudogemmobacter sonorensis]|uniref:TonB-dependent receptor domain-containing protein n=1 Tax=Pseudogemmobacter sonorensis TaxID=2989681 RepID=UPI0036C45547
MPNIDDLNPVCGIAASAPFTPHATETREQPGFYPQDRMEIGTLTVTAGLRHDRYESRGRTTTPATGATTPYDVKASKTSGRIGATYDFGNGFAPYASCSSSFEPQSSAVTGLDASGNLASFEAMTRRQWELGLRYEPGSFPGLFTVALFDIRRQNMIVSSGIANPGCSTPANCSTRRARSARAGSSLRPGPRSPGAST